MRQMYTITGWFDTAFCPMSATKPNSLISRPNGHPVDIRCSGSYHIGDVLVGGVLGVDGLTDPLDGEEPARLVLHEPLELVVPEPRDALAVEDGVDDLKLMLILIIIFSNLIIKLS